MVIIHTPSIIGEEKFKPHVIIMIVQSYQLVRTEGCPGKTKRPRGQSNINMLRVIRTIRNIYTTDTLIRINHGIIL